jgi:hypothetical protein
MAQTTRTIRMQAGNGYAIPTQTLHLDENTGAGRLTARLRSGEAWLKPIHAAPYNRQAPAAPREIPAKPTASPAPAPGAVSEYAHLTAGEVRSYGTQLHHSPTPSSGFDIVWGCLVWCEADGELELDAH